jgi:hypothetical protein
MAETATNKPSDTRRPENILWQVPTELFITKLVEATADRVADQRPEKSGDRSDRLVTFMDQIYAEFYVPEAAFLGTSFSPLIRGTVRGGRFFQHEATIGEIDDRSERDDNK